MVYTATLSSVLLFGSRTNHILRNFPDIDDARFYYL